jgi:hypothetical protein
MAGLLSTTLFYLALQGSAFQGSAPQVDNLTAGETLRHPVALLEGSSAGERVEVRNLTHRSAPAAGGAVAGGRFKALAELRPGANELELRAGGSRSRFRLNYLPATSPYRVRVVYVVASDRDPSYQALEGQRQAVEAKLDTAAKLMQTFTAESMHRAGYGRRTFQLELDPAGRTVVHVRRYPMPPDELRRRSGNELWGNLYGWIDRQFPMKYDKSLVVMGFARWDPEAQQALAHTALGGGGMGLFSSLAMWSWPSGLEDVERAFSDDTPVDTSRVGDDSAHRGVAWAAASTTIGAMLHELGHAFGLPHTGDPLSIMTRGFDRFNRMFTLVEPASRRNAQTIAFLPEEIARWESRSAAQLAPLRWFEPDARAFDDTPPRIAFDRARDEIVVSAKNGVAAVVFMGSPGEIGNDDAYKAFHHEGFQSDRPAERRYPVAELRKKQEPRERFRVQVLDGDGNSAEMETAWARPN